MGVSKGRMPLTYPGVTTGIKRLPVRAFDPLIERIKELPLWKATTLSFVGKVTLVKVTLQAIPTYPPRKWPNGPAWIVEPRSPRQCCDGQN